MSDDVGDEEEDQGTLRDAAEYACSVTWFPASCVKRARACRSTCDRSSTIPSRVEPAAAPDSPTVRAGSGRSRVTETISAGAVSGRMSSPHAARSAVQHVVRDPGDRAVDRRVDVGSGRRADVERRRLIPGELVPDEARARAEDALEQAPQQSLVAAAAEWVERQRSVVHRVVADRGHAVPFDRQLQPSAPCVATISGSGGRTAAAAPGAGEVAAVRSAPLGPKAVTTSVTSPTTTRSALQIGGAGGRNAARLAGHGEWRQGPGPASAGR